MLILVVLAVGLLRVVVLVEANAFIGLATLSDVTDVEVGDFVVRGLQPIHALQIGNTDASSAVSIG